ncbi:MAG: cobaltochelatase subunit CobN, partial [Rhodobacteraceae bacterium]|nr:cobaltochelatase subunit CobN [Paracoccaceae bacterium]
MHLIAATAGDIEDGAPPVDLGQSPADIVVLSAADTELAALSVARAEMDNPPPLRLANLMHLRHPMAVDMHLDNCAGQAKLVIARVLGGMGYWRYGMAQYSARPAAAGIPFVALPGDDKPDDELRALSTVSDTDYQALWSYLTEGGPANAAGFLTYAAAMLTDAERPPAARPLLKAGLYWPGMTTPDLAALRQHWTIGAPVIPVVFYRALTLSAGLAPIDRLTRALLREGLNPMPIFVASLKDPVSAATLDALLTQAPPSVILNATSFAAGSLHSGEGSANPLSAASACESPVFQIVLSSGTEASWAQGTTGLSPREIAMNVALPEVDGRILSRAIAFKDEAYFDEATECPIAIWRPQGDRISFVAELTRRWASLRNTDNSACKTALILANYPNKDGRLANGVGLDTPASLAHLLGLMQAEGYDITDAPQDSAAIMTMLMAGPTNWLTDRADRTGGETLPLALYNAYFKALPFEARQEITERWGAPEDDPFVADDKFALSLHKFGNTIIGLQPARGYNVDPEATYHDPALVPPHHYLAFYFWLRHHWGAQAIVHLGKHGNLEWLPGKALALSNLCWPEITLGPMPHLYPFIVNDPGEGTQAKRRAQAVIIDHLTPPLTRAETYGPLADLEALVDEYYEASSLDPARAAHLATQILDLAASTGIAEDAGLTGAEDLTTLDAWLCEIKEAQIRDGLHIFGLSPTGRQERDLTLALARLPRGKLDADASLIRALADDLGLDFDPLSADLPTKWTGPRPAALTGPTTWRSTGDTVERLELLSQRLLDSEADPQGAKSAAVLTQIAQSLRPKVAASGPAEGAALLTALSGRAIAPGPSGAP